MSTLEDTGPVARRREALAVSGWGAPFRFVQPHNLAFWVYVAMLAVGVRHVWQTVAVTGPAYGEALEVAALTSFAFGGVYVVFLRHLDHWERTPAKLALAAFLIGGFGGTWAIAITGNSAMMSIYAKLFGQGWAQDWKAGLTAPFVEETAKGACFLLLLALAPVTIRTVYDGIIVGAFVGLGFQIVEDALYGANSAIENFGQNQSEAVLGTFAVRVVTGISSHALYTALFAAGLVYVIGTVAQPRRVGRGVLLMLAAMLIHGVWDSAAALGRGGVMVFVILLATTVFSIWALAYAIKLGGVRERAFVHDVLAPEVDNGTLTEPELAALTGRRSDKKAAVKERPDEMSRRREKHVLAAARDLAQDLAVSGGEDSAEVEHSRAEIARLRRRGSD